ncbi:hypothetical protein QDF31_000494 [Escherichia coli]|nr:hypothetical protein [Escherichia coli]
MQLALKICQGMCRVIGNEVTELKKCNPADRPLRRQQLRIFSEYALNTLHQLTKNKYTEDGKLRDASTAEKELIKKAKLIERDIKYLLDSVDCYPF